MHQGIIKGFDIKPFIEAAKWLIISDEFEKADWLLTYGIPAYYRDNPPPEVLELRAKMYTQWMNLKDYTVNPDDMIWDLERAVAIVGGTARGKFVHDTVKDYNDKGITPHIVDMGPGEFWLAPGLKEKGLKFTYYGYCLQSLQEGIARRYLGDTWKDKEEPGTPVIFNACEIIEHLTKPTYDIPQLFYRLCPKADWIILSTPAYTCGEGNFDWDNPEKTGRQGHLRAYTPQEFFNECKAMFSHCYDFQFVPDAIMMVIGKRKRSEYGEWKFK